MNHVHVHHRRARACGFEETIGHATRPGGTEIPPASVEIHGHDSA